MESVTIVFSKDKLNKKEFAPSHLQIIEDGKLNYIFTGEMISEKH